MTIAAGERLQDLVLKIEAGYGESVTVSGVAPGIDVSAGASSTAVLDADLSLRRPSTLAQSLEMIPGIGTISEGQGATPAIRGLARGRTLILVDGARVSTERGAGPNASFLDPGTLGRIDVVRGPGSVAYGTDAFGGVIAARSRWPVPSADSARGSPPPPARGYRNIAATSSCRSAMTAAPSSSAPARASSRTTPRPKVTCRSRAGATTGGGSSGNRPWAPTRSLPACRSMRRGTSAVRETIRTPSSRPVHSSVRSGLRFRSIAPRGEHGAISASPLSPAARNSAPNRTGCPRPAGPGASIAPTAAHEIFRCERRRVVLTA